MAVLLLLASLGCTNSGLGRTTPTGDTAPTSIQDCPWVGTWELTEVKCSTLPYDAWRENYVSAEMVIDHDAAGGCAVTMTLKANECERVEAWHFSVPVGTSVDVTFLGIQDCEPNRCLMEPGAAECRNGELEAPTQEMAIDGSDEGKLEARNLLADTAEGCPLDVVTVWERE